MTCGYLKSKSCRYIKILVLALVIFSPASNAAWIDITPIGDNVTDFTLAPSRPAVLIATTFGAFQGVYYSINSGSSWTRPWTIRPYDGAAIKADNESLMLAGVLGDGVDISVDSGDNFAATNFSASHDSWIIAFSPSSVNTVYAAGYTSGAPDTGILQKSITDPSIMVDWDSFAIGGDLIPPTFSLAIAPTDANTVYVGAQPSGDNNDGLYKTTDGAVSWSYLSSLNITLVNALAVDPTDPDYVYAGTAGSGLIQRSSDGGANWAIVHDPNNGGVTGFSSVRGLAINPADRRIIYAVGGSGTTKVIVSTDCGVSWRNVDANGLVNGLPDKVVIDPINDWVMVRTTFGFMYREALLTNATGDCSANPGAPRGDGGAFGYLLLGMLMLIGVVRYRTGRISA